MESDRYVILLVFGLTLLRHRLYTSDQMSETLFNSYTLTGNVVDG